MTQPAQLDNVAHAGLHIHTGHGARFGDAVQSALLVPEEFRNAQAHYPIVFQKSADGTQFNAVALFGLEPGQNLFLSDGQWDAHYLPMAVERQPFLIGMGEQALMIQVDLASPRIAAGPAAGTQAVFLPHGGSSDFLDRINALLLALHHGMQQMRELTAALLSLNLLEAFVLDIELEDGSEGRLSGYYTLHEERLAALPGEALERLSRAGHLVPIHMVLASMSRWRDLIDRRNRLMQPA
ncbi:SapC family protein [Pelomonas sp. Root1444]|uniref:SapC family protein n=1 Tax=Pelomonas sp. Root1444 TaxID=1736464 RepID=UPI000703338A|nr:SapC family protein [Pelomonas sp. Root1444]KQY86783.1 hypothetical protein ASD35_18530 [Pelomonas sp. Root1444]